MRTHECNTTSYWCNCSVWCTWPPTHRADGAAQPEATEVVKLSFFQQINLSWPSPVQPLWVHYTLPGIKKVSSSEELPIKTDWLIISTYDHLCTNRSFSPQTLRNPIGIPVSSLMTAGVDESAADAFCAPPRIYNSDLLFACSKKHQISCSSHAAAKAFARFQTGCLTFRGFCQFWVSAHFR